MHARSTAIAALAALLVAAPVAAADQGAPARATPAAQPRDQQAPTVLASANAVVLPSGLKDAGESPAPKRPRAARVTSCRCGGDGEPAATAQAAPQR